MANVINCTNPICGTRIDVPDGAVQVICPQCNTWHFPSTSTSTSDSGYSNDIPQTPPSTNSGGMNLPPVVLPPTPVSPEPIPEPEKPRGASREIGTIGHLVTRDGLRLPLRQGQNILGRKGGDLNILDKTVSRRHCVVEVSMRGGGQGWEFVIYDIGHLDGTSSTNGVFISSRSLRLQDYERITIYNDTSIKLGNVVLVLKCE